MTSVEHQDIIPGTIFVATWGYDQTNVDYYEVTRATAKTVWLRAIASKVTRPLTAMSQEIVARPGVFVGKEFRRRVHRDGALTQPFVAIDSVHGAHPWNGQPEFSSSWS